MTAFQRVGYGMYKSIRRLSFFSVIFFLSSCLSATQTEPADGVHQLAIMAYNVENLFDTIDNPEKEDDTFLPIELKRDARHKQKCMKIGVASWQQDCLYFDWDEGTLKKKMERLADVVKSVNAGRGPDILLLEEVENIEILERFNTEYLSQLGYRTVVLLEGRDDRGIDQAILSRLPLYDRPINHPLPLKATGAGLRKDPSLTRGLLQANLVLPDRSILTVFAVHLPAGGGAHDLRVQAVDFIHQVKASLPPGRMAIVGGDFNINAREDSEHSMYGHHLGRQWLVSHHIGCHSCRGTNYFSVDKTWSFLDALLFTPDMDLVSGTGRWYVEPTSVNVPTASRFQVSGRGLPVPFSAEHKIGVSDHLPIYAVIKRRD